MQYKTGRINIRIEKKQVVKLMKKMKRCGITSLSDAIRLLIAMYIENSREVKK